jgi:GT2 family glycosyltransferase
MDVSIIIVNWNSTAFVEKCLKSIYENAGSLDFEVVVVDNASGDGCREMVRRDFSRVHFIQSERNLGFAGANNIGARRCSGRNLLFLNPDTEIIGTALQSLINVLDRTHDAGIVGPKLLNSDLSVQASCIQRFPSILNQVLDSEFLRGLFPRSALWGTHPLLEDSAQPVSVDVIAGACLMIKADVFAKLGGFDTGYFMYAEDVDLCFSAARMAWKNYYVSSASVVHHGGRSSDAQSENHFAAIVMRESVYKFLRNKRGPIYAAYFRWVIAGAALLRIGLLCIGVAVSNEPQGALRKVALQRWVRLFRWAIGQEKWAAELGAETAAKNERLTTTRPYMRNSKELSGVRNLR